MDTQLEEGGLSLLLGGRGGGLEGSGGRLERKGGASEGMESRTQLQVNGRTLG